MEDGALLQQLHCYHPSQPAATPRGAGASSSCRAHAPPRALAPRLLLRTPLRAAPPPLPPAPTGRRVRHQFCGAQASWLSDGEAFATQPVLWMRQGRLDRFQWQATLTQHVQMGHWLSVSVIC
jgi:hypothetical protein